MQTFQEKQNANHFTKERLKCNICGRWTETVIEIDDTDIACFLVKKDGRHCWREMFENSFYANPNKKYLTARIVTDVLFQRRRVTKQKERQKVTLKIRFSILQRDGFSCVLCGKHPPETTLEVDHVKPICKGGTSEDMNLRTLCFNCNHGRTYGAN